MKARFLAFAFVVLLVAGCSGEAVVGPEDTGHVVEPAEDCSLDAKLC